MKISLRISSIMRKKRFHATVSGRVKEFQMEIIIPIAVTSSHCSQIVGLEKDLVFPISLNRQIRMGP